MAFIVPGRPITWKRPKKHGGGRTDDPRAMAHLRTLTSYFVAEAAKTKIRYPDEPISARLHFHFNGRSTAKGFTGIELFPYCPPWEAPESLLVTRTNFVLEPCTDRIDIDNLAKLVLEAASGAKVVGNDSQFVRVELWKTGTTKGAST